MSEQFWNITAQGREAEIDIFGPIGDISFFEESTSAAEFVREMRSLRNISTLHVNIHSPGGSIMDGMLMYRTIRDFKAKTIARVPVLAASIATVVALGADEVHVGPEAIWAIHNPMASVNGGTEKDFVQVAGVLAKARENILNIYERRTGGDRDQLSDLMDQESRMTGEEIKEIGFADAVMQDPPKRRLAACSLELFDHWRNPPEIKANPAPLPREVAARLKKVSEFK